jgi:branched-subunit amino acid aminotransferase/4-amino-4-deoxychorismate lyase
MTALLRWNPGEARLDAVEPADAVPDAFGEVRVADSWLVSDGNVLGLSLHRDRFLRSAGLQGHSADLSPFWDAAVAALPRSGDWFPRVDLRAGTGGAPELLLHLRAAPARSASVVVASHEGADPRRTPAIKGPDLERLGELRAAAAQRGAGEVVITAEDGSVIEGCYSAMLWWRGDALCTPGAELSRVDSVTARSVLTLAAALGVDVLHERRTPAELDGLEVWAVNAAQAIRIVREWQDGPALAAEPGRLALWRTRLQALRRPLPHTPS